jgi:hypothetical protein
MAATAPAQPTADLSAAMANVSVSSPATTPAMRSSPAVRIATATASSGPKPSTLTPDYPARKLVRRDSLDRREALLKGKEGSRQRRRWENGKCLPP